MKYTCAFLIGLTVALASSVGSSKKLSDMRESEAVLLDYAYLNSFAVDDLHNMQIRLQRDSSGWRAQCTFRHRTTKKPTAVSLTLSRKQVEALDAAIAPKVYGGNDIRLSGEHVIQFHWVNGVRHEIRKTGDDDRFMKLIWRIVSE